MGYRRIVFVVNVILMLGLLCSPIAAAHTYPDYLNAINKAADRLVALQSPCDFGWDWRVTGLTQHSDNPSATNLYGVTALGLIDAYLKTYKSEYFNAAKNVADFITYGNPSAGDFYNGLYYDFGHGPSDYYWGYSFDYKFLLRFSEVSGDTSYRDYALAAWAWQRTNRPVYNDGNEVQFYNYFVSHVNHGFAGWGVSDFAMAAWEMGDVNWARALASVVSNNLGNIMSSPTLSDLGMAWSLRMFVTIDPVSYASEITSLINQLKADQHPDGYWDDDNSEGNAQTTAYAVMGLWAAGEYEAARKGAEWLLANQLANGGWEASPTEYSETDSEALQALVYAMPSPPVGGIWSPINAFELLAPWIALASATTISIAVGARHLPRKRL
ncbi:MAG: hypothetical protein QW667_03425 [Candidatus Bathyarchaeia archaeon]